MHYFLSSIKTVARGQIDLVISCSFIDGEGLRMVLGEHADTSGILESVKILRVAFTVIEIDYIVRALTSNSTIKTLYASVTDMELVPLLEALPRQNTLEELVLFYPFLNPDKSLKKIGEYVGRSTLKRLELKEFSFSLSLLSEEAVKEWVQSVVVGGNSLIRFLEYSQVAYVSINIAMQDIPCPIDGDSIQAQLHSLLQETVTSVNLEREKKLLASLDFNISC